MSGHMLMEGKPSKNTSARARAGETYLYVVEETITGQLEEFEELKTRARWQIRLLGDLFGNRRSAGWCFLR